MLQCTFSKNFKPIAMVRALQYIVNTVGKHIVLPTVFLCSFVNFVFAQSNHASKFYFGNWCIDFTNKTAKFVPFDSKSIGIDNEHYYDAYSDENGVTKLFVHRENKKVYNCITKTFLNIPDGYFKSGGGDRGIRIGTFIPNPCNENIVYYFADKCLGIDINTNEFFLLDDFDFSINSEQLSVHTPDYNGIWLLYFYQTKYYKVLISDSGFEEKGYTEFNSDNYQYNINQTQEWRIKLSRDCKYYSATPYFSVNYMYDYKRYVFYGEFDRENADFIRKDSYSFDDYDEVYSSFFSSDNSKIFYLMQKKNSRRIMDLVCVNIVAGKPDFEHYKVCKSLRVTAIRPVNECHYGLDGNVYVAYGMTYKRITKIPFDTYGNIVEKDISDIETEYSYNYKLNYISTWFSNDYRLSVCKPKILAENTCLSNSVDFSLENFSGVKTFLWNFGDGETSTEISPSHLYKKSGSYKVKLLIDGKDEYETDIEIYPQPKSPKIIETQ